MLERLFGRPTVAPRRRPHRCRSARRRARASASPLPTAGPPHPFIARSTPCFPRDCWVESVHPMQPGFHARKSASQPPLPLRHRTRPGRGFALSPALRVGARPSARSCRAAASAGRAPRASTISWPSPPRRAASRTTAAGCALAEWEQRPDGRGRELSRRGRPLPPSHGADAGRHHGGHRARPAPAGRHGRACSSGGTTSETSPPAPPQGLYFVAATYPAGRYSPTTRSRRMPRADAR